MERKRNYFIYASILNIIISIYSIMTIDKTKEKMLGAITNYPETLQEKMSTIYNGLGIYLIPSIICILFSILILIIVLKKKQSTYKGFIIGFSIILILLGSNSIISLISFINIIIGATIKGEKKEPIPQIEKPKQNKKQILSSIGLILLYFSQIFIPNNIIISLFANILILIMCILVFKKELKESIKLFKENFKAYTSYIFPKLGIMYIIYFILSFIIIFILKLGVSENQKTIESMPILYTLPLAVIYAPIVEEILFRGCIRKIIKKDIIYIIISGIIFGLLHTIGQKTLFEVLVMMIPYGVLGGFFAYLYTKTNNICTNIFCHFMHNSIAMIILIMTTI